MTAQFPFKSEKCFSLLFFAMLLLTKEKYQKKSSHSSHSLLFSLSTISLSTTKLRGIIIQFIIFAFYLDFLLHSTLFLFLLFLGDLYFVFSSAFSIIHGLGVMTFNLLRGCNKAQKIMSFHDDRVNDDKLIRYHQCNLCYNGVL